MRKQRVYSQVNLGIIPLTFATVMCGSIEQWREKDGMVISTGNKVSIEYTLSLEDKTVVDTNVGSPPLTYLHGSHQIVRGLEEGLEGLRVGDTKQVTVQAEEGYGAVNPDAFREVDKKQIPLESRKVGTKLRGSDTAGRSLEVQVAEVRDKTVLLDFNHPLAGKTLYFEIKVLDITKPPVQ